MLLPLAELVMRGRSQALAFVLIMLATGTIIWPNSIFAAAAISLVWLRIGVKEGLLLLLWSLLPTALIAYYLQSELPLLLVCSISISSWVLRDTRSWPYTLISIALTGFAAALALEYVANASLGAYIEVYERFLTELKNNVENPEQLAAVLPAKLETVFVAGLYGTMLVFSSFLSLVLARSWQARLYNPGGFQQEFHRLRLGKSELIILVLLSGLFMQLDSQYMTWVWIALFPLLIAGIALCHAVAKQRQLRIQWYVIFYFVLLFWGPLKVFVVVLAILDSLLDIRNRVNRTNNRLDS